MTFIGENSITFYSPWNSENFSVQNTGTLQKKKNPDLVTV